MPVALQPQRFLGAEPRYVFKKRQVSGWLPISIFRCLWTLKLKCQSRFIFQTEFAKALAWAQIELPPFC